MRVPFSSAMRLAACRSSLEEVLTSIGMVQAWTRPSRAPLNCLTVLSINCSASCRLISGKLIGFGRSVTDAPIITLAPDSSYAFMQTSR